MAGAFYRQLGTGVASLAFGVALSVFIFAAATGVAATTAAWLLFAASFLLMMRFWWRYAELFVRHMPSHTYWQFAADFAISFFGILAVLAVGDIRRWALLGALAMLAAVIRAAMSHGEAKSAKKELSVTEGSAAAMLIVFAAVYFLAASVEHTLLAAAVFIIVLAFVATAPLRRRKS